MGAAAGPNVVEDGLVLALDAGNTKSYPGSGTTWTDLSSGNHNATTNGPTYSPDNGGAFIFDGTNDFISATSTSSVAFGTGDFAVETWVKVDDLTANHMIWETRSDVGSTQDGLVFFVYGGNNDEWQVWTAGGSKIAGANGSVAVDTWYHTVVTRISGTTTLYVNNVSIGSFSDSYNYSNDDLYIGKNVSAANWLKGDIAAIRIYNGKGLTAAEVLQNYNAIKSRYGSLPGATTGTVFDFTGGSLPSGMYQDSDGPTVTWGANSVELAGNAPNDGASYPLRIATSFTGDYLFQLSTRIDLDPSGSNWCSDAGIGLFNTAYNTSDWTWKWGALSGRIAAQNDCKKPSLYGHTNATGMTSPNGGNVLITPYVADGGWVTMHLYHEPSQSRTRYKVTLGSNDWDASGTQIGDAPNSGVLQVSDSFSGTYYVGIGADDDDDECHMSAFRYVAL